MGNSIQRVSFFFFSYFLFLFWEKWHRVRSWVMNTVWFLFFCVSPARDVVMDLSVFS